MSKETILDKFGRVLIPKDIRDHLGLEPGTALEVLESAQEIRLVPVHDSSPLALKGRVLVHRGKAVGDVEGALQRDRERRARKLSFRSRK